MSRWLFRGCPRTMWDFSYTANFMTACYLPVPSGHFISQNKSVLWNVYWHETCLISAILRKSYFKKIEDYNLPLCIWCPLLYFYGNLT